ncbi:YoaK family small membrane protein [Enterobacter cloacae]
MKIGYLFPIAIFIAAVALLCWFILGGYAIPAGADNKAI